MPGRPKKQKWLIFIDTNILLDYYRIGGDLAEKQLDSLLRHRQSIITSEQIRMEFLKNRQKVIFETIKSFKKPENIALPTIIRDMKAASMLGKRLKASLENHKKIRSKIQRILETPTREDVVYQKLMNIFEHDWPFNLKRPNPERFRIRRLALKRFLLGYPPRKPNETSYGDAINWEWLISCATRCTENENILIVSRDGDYGLYLDGDHCILNDWLKREFRDRVGVNRKIELSNKLTYALRKLDETVTKEEEEQEERILEKDNKLSALYSYVLPSDSITGEKLDDVIRRILAVRAPKNDGESDGQ